MAGPGHFHPVPVRPVFGPQPDAVALPVSAPGEMAPLPADAGPSLEEVPTGPSARAGGAGKPPRRLPVQPTSATVGCPACR